VRLIKNFDKLATSRERKVVLELVEQGLQSIRPEKVISNSIFLSGTQLSIKEQIFDLKQYRRVFLIGFGKGSGGIAKMLERMLGAYLTDGYVIDNVKEQFRKLDFTLGTHPLPSEINISFTKTVLNAFSSLTEKDLILVVICGGGSAMFEAPYKVDFETLTKIFDALLKSGATISEMNTVRKHLSRVKGGGLAKHLYPAKVVSLLFSDVPGSNLSVIASGPTVKEVTTIEDALRIIKQYKITDTVSCTKDMFTILPSEEKYFKNVSNILIVSNMTAITAMREKANKLGFKTHIYSDRAQGDAKMIGEKLIKVAKKGEILLVGGETTVKVTGSGKGGRNQTLVLAALPYLEKGTIIASFDSDGLDFYHFAGAIGDEKTVKKAKKKKLDISKFLSDDNSYAFFEKTGDGIFTDKLDSNVSDLMIVFKP
jgi:glycerate-2-kinase